MKNTIQIILFLFCIVFINTNLSAQTDDWTIAKTKDDKTTVKYNISSRTDENGDLVPLIEYTVTTTDIVNMQNCISVLKDVSKHKEFHDDDVSIKIKAITENEWILYYYIKGMGPIPDSDCVVKMTIFEDVMKKMAVFTLTAAPSLFEKKDVKRFTYYNESITFKDLENGKVEITVSSKVTPPIKVPVWMMKAAFPETAYDVVRKIVKLAKES